MLTKSFLTAFLFSVSAHAWTLTAISGGDNFINAFDYFTEADPTHGFVKYVDGPTAVSSRLLYTQSDNKVIIKADNTNVTPNGRPSIRLVSKSSYNKGLFLLDLDHMPVGCGTWPAFWMVGDNWPNNGEIDIIEGVNRQATNAVTLHTSAGCTMQGVSRSQTGFVTSPNCDVNAPGQGANVGCGVSSRDTNSYGTGFNNNNGGIYATKWMSDGIKVWFFPRQSIPADINANTPNPESWGTPIASFPFQASCPSNKFRELRIVLNLTFCGDWAGSVYGSSGCPSNCVDYVKNNPSAFNEAYWKINSLRIYQQQ